MDMSDIITVKQNVTLKKKSVLSEENIKLLKMYLFPEYLFYNHFLKIMKRKIHLNRDLLKLELKEI